MMKALNKTLVLTALALACSQATVSRPRGGSRAFFPVMARVSRKLQNDNGNAGCSMRTLCMMHSDYHIRGAPSMKHFRFFPFPGRMAGQAGKRRDGRPF